MAEPRNEPRVPRRPAVSRYGVLAYGLAAAVIVLDQLSKAWVLKALDFGSRPPLEILPFFHLNLTHNAGISFGLFRAETDLVRWLLVSFALAVVAALALWARRIGRTLTAFAVGLILGGAIGNNLIDRVRTGSVTDFLDFHPLFPWVFNVADSAITVGVALLLLESFLKPEVAASDRTAA